MATSSKPIYQNKHWLYKKYIQEGLRIVDIAKEADCVPHTIYNWLYNYSILLDQQKITKVCECCGRKYIVHRQVRTRQKYCSAKCNHRQQYLNNRDRHDKQTKEWRKRNKKRYQSYVVAWQQKVQRQYRIMKESVGCQRCGFNEYGDSLDWHHLFEKDKPIRPTEWYKNNPKFLEEIEKCVLLCKNCHHQIDHNGNKKN